MSRTELFWGDELGALRGLLAGLNDYVWRYDIEGPYLILDYMSPFEFKLVGMSLRVNCHEKGGHYKVPWTG